jgi:hypothetical protein
MGSDELARQVYSVSAAQTDLAPYSFSKWRGISDRCCSPPSLGGRGSGGLGCWRRLRSSPDFLQQQCIPIKCQNVLPTREDCHSPVKVVAHMTVG